MCNNYVHHANVETKKQILGTIDTKIISTLIG